MLLDHIYNEHCLETLKRMPDEFIQCCVTSPPYFGLRDYGTGKWEGGKADCDHKGSPMRTKANINANCGTGVDRKNASTAEPVKGKCPKCGAVRIDSQIGLEPTPAEYVAKMVEVFEEVRRVLKNDGTCWLNLGDSYAESWGNYHPNSPPGKHGQRKKESERFDRPGYASQEFLPPTANTKALGMKPKDLMGIPWRVAFALQDAGWWLRQDIIWSKPNPMPESVTDRCTKAHEYIFLLTKSAKYYYDGEAIKEPITETSIARLSQDIDAQAPSLRVPGKTNGPMKAVGDRDRSLPRNRNGITGSLDAWGSKNTAPKGQTPNTFHLSRLDVTPDAEYLNRNKRSVWTVPVQPFKEAHFATFPLKLIEPMIAAGSKEGDIVYDPFMGAGTTGVMARILRRRFIGSELNPEYIKIANKRLEPYMAQNDLF